MLSESFDFTLYLKALSIMSNKAVESIEEIKSILNKNTRILSLSGWSGIMAGVVALIAAAIAQSRLDAYYFQWQKTGYYSKTEYISLRYDLMMLGLATLLVALLLATYFTWRKIRKEGDQLLNKATLRLISNMAVPLLTGGIMILYLLQSGFLNMVAPSCLIFYGLALFTASKFTLGEIKYLGLICIALGLMNLWMYSYSLLFWSLGFGVAHIIYGMVMLKKYD